MEFVVVIVEVVVIPVEEDVEEHVVVEKEQVVKVKVNPPTRPEDCDERRGFGVWGLGLSHDDWR